MWGKIAVISRDITRYHFDDNLPKFYFFASILSTL